MKKRYYTSKAFKQIECYYMQEQIQKELQREDELKRKKTEGVSLYQFILFYVLLFTLIMGWVLLTLFAFEFFCLFLELWFMKAVIITLPGAVPGLFAYKKKKQAHERVIKKINDIIKKNDSI